MAGNYRNEREMKKTMMILSLAALLFACTDPRQKEVNELRKEAIQLHDDVMPRMGEMVELSGELKKMRASIMDAHDSTGKEKMKYTLAITELEVAHEGMMAWMNNFDPTYDESNPLDSAVVYYKQQRDAISMVKQSMEQSIQKSESLKNEAK